MALHKGCNYVGTSIQRYIALYCHLVPYFPIFQLLYQPELHLALRISESELEGRHSKLYSAPMQEMKAKDHFCWGWGLPATRCTAKSGTRVTHLHMCGHVP